MVDICDGINERIFGGRNFGIEEGMEVMEVFGWCNFWMDRRYFLMRWVRNVCVLVIEISERSGFSCLVDLYDSGVRGLEVSGFRDRGV